MAVYDAAEITSETPTLHSNTNTTILCVPGKDSVSQYEVCEMQYASRNTCPTTSSRIL